MDISVSDAFGVASAFLFSLGGGGLLVVGLSGWLGRVWANRLMQQDIAKHSSELEELKNKFEAVNKRLQAELDKTLHVHRVQFEAEFKALSEIWAKLSAVRSSLAVSSPKFSDAETEQERLKRLNDLTGRFTDSVSALKQAVHDQGPFYPKAIYEKLDEVIVILANEERDLEQDKGNVVALSLWLDVNTGPTLEKVTDLADQISDLIRHRIENLSLLS
jgi:hypothetical protein